MAALPKTCAECSTTLGPRNTSGYCARHVGIANMRRPGVREKAARNMRLRLAADPVLREGYQARMRAHQALPQAREARRQRWLAEKPWIKGNEVQPKGGEARQRMAASISARRLAWCPPELRDDYRLLTNVKGLKAAEAREMILEQHEAEMARFRRSIGAPA